MKKQILSVGQCGYDHGQITRAFQSAFGAEVVGADTNEEALEALQSGQFALVLVNRVLDANGEEGLELIERIKQDAALKETPVMLVSNHDAAQEQAIAAGATLGFGKAALSSPQVIIERVRTVIGE